jgi:excisionase family DNA binding protein
MMRKRRDMGNDIVRGQIYTPSELAEVLKVGKQTIYNKLSKGEKLPKCFRIGSRVRFTGAAIQEFIMEQM